MRFIICWVILTLFCGAFCLNDEVEEQYEESREGKQLSESIEQKGWRVLDSDEWVPRNSAPLQTDDPEIIPRRRRIRKRKRRPPQSSSEESKVFPQRRRRIRPQNLQQANDHWSNIEDESLRPYNRRRTSLVYTPVEPLSAVLHFGETEEVTKPQVYEKVRDPFTALEEAEAKARLKKKQQEIEQETTTVSHLKALLKQSAGSLSLSELLQQKNLSLEDLLNGKQHAISALTEKSEYINQDFTESVKILQLTTENSLKRNYETFEDSSEINAPKEEDKALLENNGGAKLYTTKQYEVITKPTTERRIFVPSRKYNKPWSTEKIPTTSGTSSTHKYILGNKYLDYRSKYVSLKPKLKTLPMTSAKLNSLITKRPILSETTAVPETTPLPPKELLETTTKLIIEEGPVKMSFDIDKLMEQMENDTTTTVSPKIDLKILENLENEVTTEIKISPEKTKPTSAREEIMEILRDHISGENLSRILELRNMTVEELVAQRERGSSQLHLADIFHNQTREPEPPNEPYVGHIRSISTSLFDRKPKTIPILPVSNYFPSVVDIKPLKLKNKEAEYSSIPGVPIYTVTSFPTYKIEMEKIMKNNQPAPFQISLWKNLYPDLYTGGLENPNPETELDALKPTKIEDIVQNDIRRVEEVDNTISDAINGQLNIELNENNYEDVADYISLPRGVKSTIIVSAAIIGISVFVFLTVFIIFKWLQKRKKRLSYSNSFSCSRIKSPILETRPRRTIRTIMSETLGRKKKYSNVYPQSMSDYVWESDKKPFQ